ncbi:hypothetical protein [Paracoccus salsus]|uniref:hypothetical protein n=1 Tax=Paracoccus salsus TaxID=2911061 RepID=UPI001F1C0978|nr:hypothetical protein [Paracoccus salsus]MCF3973122.1 hypothetical protein [Paracoccus salsus]
MLDEPAEGIQPGIITQIGRVIAARRDRGDMAIVLVEQLFGFAWHLGDEFPVLERGHAVLQGQKSDLRREDPHASLAGHAEAV